MTMPSNADIFEHWKKWLAKNGFDWREPSCWACGIWWDDDHDVDKYKAIEGIKK